MKSIICVAATMVVILGLFIYLNVNHVYAQNNNDSNKSDVASGVSTSTIKHPSLPGEVGRNNKTMSSPAIDEESVKRKSVSGPSTNSARPADCCEAGTCRCH
jgi:hypothetical protein